MPEEISLKQRAARGVQWKSSSTAITGSLHLVQIAVLARILSPRDFGLIAVVTVVTGLVQKFSDLGIGNAIIQQKDPTKGQLSSLYWLTVAAGAVGTFVAASAPFLIRGAYGPSDLSGLILLYAPGIFISSLGYQFSVLLQKGLKFKRLAFVEISAASVGVGASVVSALSGLGVYSFVWGYLSSSFVYSALAIYIGRQWRPSLHFSRKDLIPYIGFGLYQTGEKAADYLLWNMDKLLIGKLLGAEALGFYSVAFQLAVKPLNLITPVITGVSFPVFAIMKGDNARLKRVFLRVVEVLSLLNFPVYFGMLAVAKPLIEVIFGAGWAPSVPLFQILVLFGFFIGINEPIGGLLLAKGRAALSFRLNLLYIPIYAGAVLVGSNWGITGVCWGMVVAATALTQPIEFWLRWSVLGIKPFEYIGRLAPFLAISAIMAVGVKFIDGVFNFDDALIRLTVLALSGIFFYTAGILLFKRPLLKEAVRMVFVR